MRRQLVWPSVSLLVFLSVWQIGDWVFAFNVLILPNPLEICRAIVFNWQDIVLATAVTMTEAVVGFALAGIVAYAMAVLFVQSSAARDALYPFAVALKSTPLIALAPLLVLWFGNGMMSKIVMAALVAFFPVLVTSVQGLANIDRELIDMLRSMSATPTQVFWKVRIPGSLPYLFASLRVASSLAVVGAVIGEFTGSTMGIGYLLNTSSYYLETPLLFGGIFAISIAGIIFFYLVAWAEKRLLFWQEQGQDVIS